MKNRDLLNETVDYVLSSFSALLETEDILDIGNTIPIPILDTTTVIKLCHIEQQLLQKQPSLLRISPPIVVVGDLHGSFHDLLRLFSLFHQPPATKYLFLGDYVDRGPFSLEVLIMLIAYQCAYPDQVFLIRGNHEIASVNSQYGFKLHLLQIYNFDDIWRSFQKVFDWLPFGALIGNQILCVHGGLSPLLQTVEQIDQIPRPQSEPDNQLLLDILWSDPTTEIKEFGESERGIGKVYGPKAICDFCEANKLKWLIRAHQCVNDGIAVIRNTPIITVFSSSNYTDAVENKSGILLVNESNDVEPICLPALKKFRREDSSFFSMTKVYHRGYERSVSNTIKTLSSDAKFHNQTHFGFRQIRSTAPREQRLSESSTS